MVRLAIMVIAGALGMTIYTRWPVHHPTGNLACYSDDDGQTWFADSTWNVVPFDHNGKSAVRAFVFSYDGGSKTFILALMRYTVKGQKILNDAIARAQEKHQPLSSLELTFDAANHQEVKAPGAGNPWVPRTSNAGKAILTIQSPDGSAVDTVIP
jgi:hypothetical protein